MTEREELLRRLERVKALAERGVGGEKENLSLIHISEPTRPY